MINQDLRKAIVALHEEGQSKRAIARLLSIDRNTVRDIIHQRGEIRMTPRSDKKNIDPEILAKLYRDCSGWKERIWEKLSDDYGIQMGYSTLTEIFRKSELGKKPRAAHIGDTPGTEMQHDTSPYRVKLSNSPTNVIASLLYFRFSKSRYLKFYRSFNRFKMKSFFHEALRHYKYSAPECIIDNTNLAVLHGTGPNAVMNPEMVSFSKRYGFRFVAHRVKHSDRKAGEERSFWTVETNFFPGRTFSSLEDLNEQALRWSTETMAHRPQTKTKIIPVKAFELEIPFLNQIHDAIPAPYQIHDRIIDQYGFVAFSSNHYWLPNGAIGKAQILEYANEIKILQGRQLLATYPLPPDGTKYKIFPEDRPHVPYQPNNLENRSGFEEKTLRAHSKPASDYLDFVIRNSGQLKHRFIREMYRLYQRVSVQLFDRVIERAALYGISDIKSLENIARLLVRHDADFVIDAHFDESYEEREEYREGCMIDPPDLNQYEALLEDDEDE